MDWGTGAILVGVSVGLLGLFTYWLGEWWLWYWHGTGEAHQYQFFRCHGCRAIITHRRIVTGGCACHESVKVSPAKLRRGEKLRLLYLPWTVTPWGVRRDSVRRLALLAERAK